MSKRLSNYKLNLAIIASLFFTLVLGCQPEGGELLPINNEGLEITSSRFENDTAVINDNGFEIKVFGSWDGRAKVRVIIENNSGNSVRFDFNKSIVLDSRGEKINIDSIYEDKNSAIEQISDGQFAVANGEKRKLVIGFPLNLPSLSYEESPRIISVVLAVEKELQRKELREYKINFKGTDKKEGSDRVEPQA